MKILLASYYPLPSLGGIWTFVSQLKTQLERDGHQVDIFSHHPENKNYRMMGKPEIDSNQFRKQLYLFKRQKKLQRSIQTSAWIDTVDLNLYRMTLSASHYGLDQYDIIHAQDVIAASTLSQIKPDSVPIVTSAHGYLSGAIFYTLKSRHRHLTDTHIKQLAEYQYHNALEKKGYHSSDLIHTQSRWMQHKVVNEFSVPEEKLRVFPYALDIRQLVDKSSEQSSISKPKDKMVILYSGRLVYLKGVHHLIDALGLLKKQRNDWVCWILGEGELKHNLQRQCKDAGIEHDVEFLVTKRNVYDYLKQADLFVLPSLQDTQPHSVMEAQVAGVAVIVSNAAGLPEMVINGKTGLIAQAGDSEQLFKQINYLLDQPSIRNKLAANAKKWGEQHWSLTKLANNTLAMYNDALQVN